MICTSLRTKISEKSISRDSGRSWINELYSPSKANPETSITIELRVMQNNERGANSEGKSRPKEMCEGVSA